MAQIEAFVDQYAKNPRHFDSAFQSYKRRFDRTESLTPWERSNARQWLELITLVEKRLTKQHELDYVLEFRCLLVQVLLERG